LAQRPLFAENFYQLIVDFVDDEGGGHLGGDNGGESRVEKRIG